MAQRRNTTASRTAKKKQATSKPKTKAKIQTVSTDSFHVQFSGWSTDKRATSMSLGVRISRADLPLGKADKLFCAKRVSAVAAVLRENVDPDQKQLPTMEDDVAPRFENTFDCAAFSVRPDYITIRLKIPLEDDVDLNVMREFNGRNGLFEVISAEQIPHPSASTDVASASDPVLTD